MTMMNIREYASNNSDILKNSVVRKVDRITLVDEPEQQQQKCHYGHAMEKFPGDQFFPHTAAESSSLMSARIKGRSGQWGKTFG